mgnify:CR=1 FL=1
MRPSSNRIVVEQAKRKAKEYCADNGLDISLLDRQVVYVIDGDVIFAQPSGVKANGLKNDLETQPKPTLVLEKQRNGFSVKTTEHTFPVLGLAQMK